MHFTWISAENFELDEAFVVENYEQHYQVWAKHFRSYKPEMSKMVSASHLGKEGTDRPSSDQIYLKYRKVLSRRSLQDSNELCFVFVMLCCF